MIKHQITLVRYWNLLIVFSIRVDSHSCQGMVAFFEFILKKFIICFKTFADGEQVFFFSHSKFNIVV